MKTISLCMIVKNESAVLGRCLDSVSDLVDEIIIVDTGSTDDTKSIAAQYTDKIFDFPWCDDFAAARNYAFSQGSCDYLFWLDADDVIEEKDRICFQQEKEKLEEGPHMVMMDYHVAFDENDNPTFTYRRERLVRRDCGFCWQGRIHEVIPPQGPIQTWQSAVCHRKEGQGDADRNLRIFQAMIENGETLDARQQYYYGRELYFHGYMEEAAAAFEQFLTMKDSWLENRIDCCRDLSRCYSALGQDDNARFALFRSFLWDAPRAEISCDLGDSFFQAHQYEIADFWYGIAEQCPYCPERGGFLCPDCYDFLPALGRCRCRYALGDKESAFRFHLKTETLRPDHSAVIFNKAFFASLGF
ncbi:MAG: glycosyltransferase family 2 protein [Bacillota bacterium]|nr:glycosyltransferase family 2 protein [Bacillota bacterium]